jgi:hypothetical protein
MFQRNILFPSSGKCIRVVKSKSVRLTGHVSCMEDMTN